MRVDKLLSPEQPTTVVSDCDLSLSNPSPYLITKSNDKNGTIKWVENRISLKDAALAVRITVHLKELSGNNFQSIRATGAE